MNQNCTYCTGGTNAKTNPKFSVRLSGIVYDARVAYVESVCAALIDSRFGPGRSSQLGVKLSDRPENEPAVFYDLIDDAMVPSYALPPFGRDGYQVVEAAYRKATQMGLLDAMPNGHNSAASPSNLGRGSP